MKRAISIILSLIISMSLCIGVFAEEVHAGEHSHKITILNENEGYTYVAYQIFDGTLSSSGVLSDVEWGSGVDGAKLLAALQTIPAYSGCTDAASVAATLAGLTSTAMDDPAAMAFADVVGQTDGVLTTGVTSEWVGGKYTISGLEDGYYIVVNTGVPSGTDTTVSRYIMEVVRDVTVTHKGTYPTVEKKIVDDGNKVDINEESIGNVVSYEITGTLPGNIADYDTYYYVFNDTLSKGLTYNGDMTVTVNNVDVTDYFYKNATAYDAVTGTTITVGIQDLLVLDNDNDPATPGDQPLMTAITKDTKIVLTYTATLNENAVIAGPNPNEVDLEYSNNPNDDGNGSTTPPPPPTEPSPEHPTGITPKDKVETYVTELTIEKVDGQGNALQGAEFQLEGTHVKKFIVTKDQFTKDAAGTWYLLKDGTYTEQAPITGDDPATPEIEESNLDDYATGVPEYKRETVTEVKEQTESVKIKAEVGSDGKVTFSGLGAGKYTLTETKTPDGYNTIDPIVFEVKFNVAEKKFHCDDNALIMVEADNTLMAQIVNVSGSTLPSTGGIGTTIFYILGGMMVTGSAVVLVAKKRVGDEE